LNVSKIITQSLASVLLVGALAAPASAALLTGDIGFGGDFTTTGGVSGNLSDVTGIEFGSVKVDDIFTGAFLAKGVAEGDTVLLNDVTFSPFLSIVNPLWTVGDFEFELTSVDVIHQSSLFLLLSGIGNITHPDYETNTGSWILSANSVGSQFNFSSGTSAATVVPLPAAAWLFGSALLGFISLSRRKQA
jgi:hypothetical protein